MRYATEAQRRHQRDFDRKLAQMAEASRVEHERRMDTERVYYGAHVGTETCVQDRRTGSVAFANRYVGVAWTFQHLTKRFGDTPTYEELEDFTAGFHDGYVGEMSDEEIDA